MTLFLNILTIANLLIVTFLITTDIIERIRLRRRRKQSLDLKREYNPHKHR